MYHCKVYDAGGLELTDALSSDAICWVLEGIAYVLEYYPEPIVLRTVSASYQVPKSIALVKKVTLTKKQRKLQLNNKDLFLRDDHTCQYCGRHESELDRRKTKQGKLREELTREHIVPRTAGGANTWQNCTTACSRCNSFKADRTPKQANMVLRTIPYVPSHEELKQKRKTYEKSSRPKY